MLLSQLAAFQVITQVLLFPFSFALQHKVNFTDTKTLAHSFTRQKGHAVRGHRSKHIHLQSGPSQFISRSEWLLGASCLCMWACFLKWLTVVTDQLRGRKKIIKTFVCHRSSCQQQLFSVCFGFHVFYLGVIGLHVGFLSHGKGPPTHKLSQNNSKKKAFKWNVKTRKREHVHRCVEDVTADIKKKKEDLKGTQRHKLCEQKEHQLKG